MTTGWEKHGIPREVLSHPVRAGFLQLVYLLQISFGMGVFRDGGGMGVIFSNVFFRKKILEMCLRFFF